jgi:hypothetical protein
MPFLISFQIFIIGKEIMLMPGLAASFSGFRHVYTVLAPIVCHQTDELHMNLFPVLGFPIIKITESDPKFFGSI